MGLVQISQQDVKGNILIRSGIDPLMDAYIYPSGTGDRFFLTWSTSRTNLESFATAQEAVTEGTRRMVMYDKNQLKKLERCERALEQLRDAMQHVLEYEDGVEAGCLRADQHE